MRPQERHGERCAQTKGLMKCARKQLKLYQSTLNAMKNANNIETISKELEEKQNLTTLQRNVLSFVTTPKNCGP